MRLFFAVMILIFFARCSEDDTSTILSRHYFIGNWQLEMGLPMSNEITYQLEGDNSYSVAANRGLGSFGGVWSYNEQDRELLMQGANGLVIYEVLNFSESRFEAFDKENEQIVFFNRQ
uniref:Lipocalin-like domain-containing protein n=1 Tax=Roseihalotalea indica TaxID=2867963 RepID=A0AA49GHR9_9BACT|nr:hypothetical protein K4G66_21285 [Tunicatimonas sp. TK19036]